jgi:hypothetical protein
VGDHFGYVIFYWTFNFNFLEQKYRMKLPSFFDYIIYWNRKFHIYIGLFLILFILFFAFSGLLFNHSQWEFSSFWKERKESEIITPVTIPSNRDSAFLLQYLMKQLKISGEITNVRSTTESINFRLTKPGTLHDVKVDFKSGISVRKEMVYNWWGKLRTLHTFNGSDKANPEVQPNWIVTRIWRITMDVVAIGMIFLCVSSWIMWYKIRKSYSYGLIVLILGTGGAVFFIFLLRIL